MIIRNDVRKPEVDIIKDSCEPIETLIFQQISLLITFSI